MGEEEEERFSPRPTHCMWHVWTREKVIANRKYKEGKENWLYMEHCNVGVGVVVLR